MRYKIWPMNIINMISSLCLGCLNLLVAQWKNHSSKIIEIWLWRCDNLTLMMIFFWHPICKSHKTLWKMIDLHYFYHNQPWLVAGALMTETLISFYKILTDRSKMGTLNENFIIHPIFISRDTYDKWTHRYWFYTYPHQDCVGVAMAEALISINDNFTHFSSVDI